MWRRAPRTSSWSRWSLWSQVGRGVGCAGCELGRRGAAGGQARPSTSLCPSGLCWPVLLGWSVLLGWCLCSAGMGAPRFGRRSACQHTCMALLPCGCHPVHIMMNAATAQPTDQSVARQQPWWCRRGAASGLWAGFFAPHQVRSRQARRPGSGAPLSCPSLQAHGMRSGQLAACSAMLCGCCHSCARQPASHLSATPQASPPLTAHWQVH